MPSSVTAFGPPPENPRLSIVIVTCDTGPELLECLASLERQTVRDFETILVDNGSLDLSVLSSFVLTYMHLGGVNHGPSAARNAGARVARAEVLAFLDDDAIANRDWVEAILSAFADEPVIAVQGQIWPKTPHCPWNDYAAHYWVGDHAHPWLIDLEGNSAVRRAEYLQVGGFDADLFGGEGAEFTFRLTRMYPAGVVLYDPAIIIRHDYADSLAHFIAKNFRHGRTREIGPGWGPEVDQMATDYYNAHHIAKRPRGFRNRARARIVHAIGGVSGAFGRGVARWEQRRRVRSRRGTAGAG